MTTTSKPCSKESTERLDLSNHSPLDLNRLRSMANDFFPELFSDTGTPCPCCQEDAPDGMNPQEVPLTPQVCNHIPSEDDFLQAIASLSDPWMDQMDLSMANAQDTDAFPCPDTLTQAEPIGSDRFSLFFSPFLIPDSKLSDNTLDVDAVRRDFPILSEKVNGKDLVWFDNAATTQKPQCVIERLKYFYEHENSNIHRAAHTLAARTTDAYEDARAKTVAFLGAASAGEIVFVRGTTEAINLVAQAYALRHLKKDDEVIISHLEHHANIVPWQMVCAQTEARLRVIPVDEDGQIILQEYGKMLCQRTKMVAFTHVSNALGTVTPVAEMTAMAHRYGAKVFVDGAQAVPHSRVNVQALGCDFYTFSGHKIYGPTGIGALYGKADVLEAMQPWQGGGNMISDVTFEKTRYQPPPHRFEAGTGSIAAAIGLACALDYVSGLGMDRIANHEHELLDYATELLKPIPGLRFIGTAKEKASILSFVLKGYAAEEVAQALNREGIAVRAGHHCAQPILRRFGLESTVRPSLAFYNTRDEVDRLASVLWELTDRRGPSR